MVITKQSERSSTGLLLKKAASTLFDLDIYNINACQKVSIQLVIRSLYSGK
jgi:hypothetical protein